MILSRRPLWECHVRTPKRCLSTSCVSLQGDEGEEVKDGENNLDKTTIWKAELSSQIRFCRHAGPGRVLHHHVLRHGLELEPSFPNLLVLMYTNCLAYEEARVCLTLLPQCLQNVSSWNFLFKALGLEGLWDEILHLYICMVAYNVLPNKVTFRSMLDACSRNPISLHVFQLHGFIRNFGLDTDPAIGTALSNLYGRTGNLHDALKVFQSIVGKDVVSWTSMMLIYLQHGCSNMTIQFFKKMQLEGIAPDRVSFIGALTACDNFHMLFEGRKIHLAVMENGLENDITLGTTIVSMYSKCGSLSDSVEVFHQMYQRSVVTWNVVIGAIFQGSFVKKAIKHFYQMMIEGILPNRETYINFLSGCADCENLYEGVLAHARLVNSGINSDVQLGNVLINMYGKCSDMKCARKVFERMKCWDVVSWTAMINAYAQHGDSLDAYLLFYNMLVKGVRPNEYTIVSIISALSNRAMSAEGRCLHWYTCFEGFDSNGSIKNALLNMYARFVSMDDAQWIFQRLHARDVISWTAMIAGFAEDGKGDKALRLFFDMQHEGKQPNEISFVNIITSCASLAGIMEGMLVHECIVEAGLNSDVEVGNALINMYGKCGSVEDAQGMFSCMPQKDKVSWNSLLSVFAQCGHGKEAVCLFDSMRCSSCSPDNVTFSSVLSSCSHAGLIGGAWELLKFFEQDHGILPAIDHYVCMVDILGRAGHLTDAARLISLMPVQPSKLAFMVLIGACQYHMEVVIGEYAAESLFEIDSESSASYVALSNIYAAAAFETYYPLTGALGNI